MMLTCLAAGVVLGILAPFGTSQLSTLFRFTYWIGLCLAGGLGASATDFIAHKLKKDLTVWPCAFFQSITAAMAVFSVITWLTYHLGGRFQGPFDALMTFFYIWVISITISSIGALIRQRGDTGKNTHSRPTLYERLPPKLRSAEIYALAAEDHYVRVITSKGDELVLMRLSDAIKETEPLKGLSPHRSYWVAEGGVKSVKKSELILHTEQAVPISRSGMKLVRGAGWV